jgi:hypothetical protein
LSNIKSGVLELQRKGCTFITSDCGFMFYYQEYVDSINEIAIPVQLSTLGLLGPLRRIYGSTKKILILTANSQSLKKMMSSFQKVDDSYIIVGAEDIPGFGDALINGEMVNVEEARDGFVNLVFDAVQREEDVGCILMECTEMPVYRKDIRKKMGIPVYSIVTMIFAYELGFDSLEQIEEL